MHKKIAIIGNKDTILGFKALGFKAFDANNPDEALKILQELKSSEESKYSIIFIIEKLLMEISKVDYKKLSEKTLPAIVPLPGIKGTTGYGIKRIGKMVEQAVGSDIFKE